MMGTGNFERRLRSILNRDTRRGIRPMMTLAVVAIFAVTITTLAVAKPVKRDVKVHVQVSEQPGESLYDRAFDFHNNEEWADAADLFEQAAAEGFRPSTSLYNAACGYARMGDASTAIDLIERAMEHGFDSHKYLLEDSDLDPIRGDAGFQELLERVKVGAHNDRFVVASKSYEKLQAEGSEDADDWYSVGTDLLSMREFDRAIDALNEANRLDGGSANALYNLACAYSLDGSTRQALDHLEQAVLQGFDSEERFANDSDLDNIRDESAFGEIKELHDSLSLDQYRKGNWGNSEYSERRWAPAIKDMQVLVQASPNTGRAWSNLGWAFHHSKRHADARDAFLRQLDLGYRSTHAIYNVGCTYAMEGQSDSAIEWIQRAVDTDDVSVHQLLNDEDLESLRDDSRWEALLQQAAAGQPYEVHRGLIQEIKHKIQEVI